MQGDYIGPLESSCPFYQYSMCTDSICTGIDTCGGCTRYSECSWCETSKVCLERVSGRSKSLCPIEPIVKDSGKQCPNNNESMEKTLRGLIRKYQFSG